MFPYNSANSEVSNLLEKNDNLRGFMDITAAITNTNSPSSRPVAVTNFPSRRPTISPSTKPLTAPPSVKVTNFPSRRPTVSPSTKPVVASPSVKVTNFPSRRPTISPSTKPVTVPPSVKPTLAVTNFPSRRPTISPTMKPSTKPVTVPPTVKPTLAPTLAVTNFPSRRPTISPSTKKPVTVSPTVKPTLAFPSRRPTSFPSIKPVTVAPSVKPTTLGSFSYSAPQANISLWLSTAAYCGKSTYKSRKFSGPTSGFVVTYVIEDVPTDTQGFIGYLPSDKSIYVGFQGSSSFDNWITDLILLKTSYTSYPECDCEVHMGFYSAEQKVIGGILTELNRLKSISTLSDYAVKTTGHSLGGALALLTAMDILKAGYSVTMYNFGQPRVGDRKFAAFVSLKLNSFRVTHARDLVPHYPLNGFYHACFEVFEDSAGSVRTCSSSTDGTCEDPECANQYYFTNADDHRIYLGLRIS
eukprot:gene25672-34245_t